MAKYSKEFKLKVVKYCIENYHSSYEAAKKFNIPSPTSIKHWVRKYNEHGEIGIEKNKKTSYDGKCILKKIASLSSEKNKAKTIEKVIVIDELRHEFKLEALLKYAEVTRSTFYYQLNRLKEPNKYKEVKEEMTAIYHENKGRYGYRRMTMELHNRGFNINHKTVSKLMKELGLQCFVRAQKYKSYKGEVGKICDNLLIVNSK